MESACASICHTISSQGSVDLLLLLLGLGVGLSTKLRTPFMLTIFLIKVVKWWMDTHPHGIEMSQKTTLDEEFRKLFHLELKHIENQEQKEAQVDKQEI